MDRGARASNRDFPGRRASSYHRQPVGEGLGQQNSVANATSLDQCIKLLTSPPRSLVEVMRGEKNGASLQLATLPQGPERFQRRGHTRLHVRCPAPQDSIPLDPWRHEGQVDGVQVPVELERGAGALRVEANHDGGRWIVAGGRALYQEAIISQDPREAVGGFARISRRAGNGDELGDSFHESTPLDELLQPLACFS